MIKKLAISLAAVAAMSGMSAIPAAAGGVTIAASDYGNVYAGKDHEHNKYNEYNNYYNQNVNYQAGYYVNYSASVTNAVKKINSDYHRDRYNFGKNRYASNYFNDCGYGYGCGYAH